MPEPSAADAAASTTRRFPDGFAWGTATAAHQIEGGNWNNDWWAFEHTPGSGVVEPSGDACDSWHRWADDVIGIDRFGTSAPGDLVLDKLGINVDNVVARATALVQDEQS